MASLQQEATEMEIAPPTELELEAQVTDKISAADFVGAIRSAEVLELMTCVNPVTDAQAPVRYARQLMLYLIVDDLDNSRHLWRRIDDGCKAAGTELAAVWEVGKQLWLRTNIVMAYTALEREWSPELAPLAAALKEAVRQRQFALLSKAYSNLSLATVCAALALTDNDASEYCTSRGWAFDPATGLLVPVKPAPREATFEGMGQMDFLARQVTFLERTLLTEK